MGELAFPDYEPKKRVEIIMAIRAIGLSLVIIAAAGFALAAPASAGFASVGFDDTRSLSANAPGDSAPFALALPAIVDATAADELLVSPLDTSDWGSAFAINLVDESDEIIASGPWPLPAAGSYDGTDMAMDIFQPRSGVFIGTALLAAFVGVLTRRSRPVSRRALRQRGNGQSGRLHAVAFPIGT